MTTYQTIQEIKELFEENFQGCGERYAVLKPLEKYDSVDWNEVSETLKTTNIESYGMLDKIVIKAE